MKLSYLTLAMYLGVLVAGVSIIINLKQELNTTEDLAIDLMNELEDSNAQTDTLIQVIIHHLETDCHGTERPQQNDVRRGLGIRPREEQSL